MWEHSFGYLSDSSGTFHYPGLMSCVTRGDVAMTVKLIVRFAIILKIRLRAPVSRRALSAHLRRLPTRLCTFKAALSRLDAPSAQVVTPSCGLRLESATSFELGVYRFLAMA